MGRFEDYPGLVGTGVQLLENRLGATPQGFESLPLRHKPRFFGAFFDNIRRISENMLPNNFSQIAERIQRQNNRSLKELFKNDIRGSFLIDIKYRVFNAIAEKFFELYDLRWSDERMVTGIGPEP